MTEDAQAQDGRRNHYVPQFYLAGFTETREKGGRLYCLDKKYAKIKPRTPSAVGYQKGLWKDAIEDALQEDENSQAPVLKAIEKEPAQLTKEHTDALIALTARLLAGTPKWFSKRADSTVEHMREIVRRHRMARWLFGGRSCLTKVFFGKRWRQVYDSFDTGPDMFLPETKGKIESLHKKSWCLLYAPVGNVHFITSDAPVCCNSSGPEQMHGRAKNYGLLNNPDILVFFPLTSKVALFGICAPMPFANMGVPAEMVAFVNTLVLSLSHQYVYSQTDDFLWISLDGKSIGNAASYCEYLKSKKPMVIAWDGRTSILGIIYNGLKAWLPASLNTELGPFSRNPSEWPKRRKRRLRSRLEHFARFCIAMIKTLMLVLEVAVGLLVVVPYLPVVLLKWLVRCFRTPSGGHKKNPP